MDRKSQGELMVEDGLTWLSGELGVNGGRQSGHRTWSTLVGACGLTKLALLSLHPRVSDLDDNVHIHPRTKLNVICQALCSPLSSLSNRGLF